MAGIFQNRQADRDFGVRALIAREARSGRQGGQMKSAGLEAPVVRAGKLSPRRPSPAGFMPESVIHTARSGARVELAASAVRSARSAAPSLPIVDAKRCVELLREAWGRQFGREGLLRGRRRRKVIGRGRAESVREGCGGSVAKTGGETQSTNPVSRRASALRNIIVLRLCRAIAGSHRKGKARFQSAAATRPRATAKPAGSRAARRDQLTRSSRPNSRILR